MTTPTRAGPDSDVGTGTGGVGSGVPDAGADTGDTEAPADAGGQSTGGPCAEDMADIGAYCMDRYEAPNELGADPLVMESAVSAEAWCDERGKRLCTEDEWDTACAGTSNALYPYGDVHTPSRCNDDKTWRVVSEAALNTWPSSTAANEVAELWQGATSGSYPECVSDYGVFDLTGNVEEWVVRTRAHAHSNPHVLKGCYWAGCFGGSKPTCASTNPAHADGFRYYETGFRCCKDLSL